jgi:hypothetical protein
VLPTAGIGGNDEVTGRAQEIVGLHDRTDLASPDCGIEVSPYCLVTVRSGVVLSGAVGNPDLTARPASFTRRGLFQKADCIFLNPYFSE